MIKSIDRLGRNYGEILDQWRRITKEILIDDSMELFSLGKPQGDKELRETIAKYLFAARGVVCTPGQIIVGAGNDYLLILLQMLLNKDSVIAFENPTYTKAYHIFENLGYHPAQASGVFLCLSCQNLPQFRPGRAGLQKRRQAQRRDGSLDPRDGMLHPGPPA